MVRRLLNGGSAPANCARKIAGPLIMAIVFLESARLPKSLRCQFSQIVETDLHSLQRAAIEVFLLDEIVADFRGAGRGKERFPVDLAAADLGSLRSQLVRDLQVLA